MSEFKVNDLVVCTDVGLEAKYLAVRKITGFIDDWGLVLNDGEHWVEKNRFRHAEPEEIAAGHRIDKTPLQKHLDECAEVVKTWPNWKVESVRKAFGIPDLGDDSHIENHISPLCKSKDV